MSNKDEKSCASTSINCLITLFATLSEYAYKIRFCECKHFGVSIPMQHFDR